MMYLEDHPEREFDRIQAFYQAHHSKMQQRRINRLLERLDESD